MRFNKVANITNKIDKPDQPFLLTLKSRYHEQILTTSQDDMKVDVIRIRYYNLCLSFCNLNISIY